MVNLTVAQRKFTVTFTVYCVAKTTDLNKIIEKSLDFYTRK